MLRAFNATLPILAIEISRYLLSGARFSRLWTGYEEASEGRFDGGELMFDSGVEGNENNPNANDERPEIEGQKKDETGETPGSEAAAA